ncbi:cell division protein FtsJ [Cohnella pontilimi]|uniref:Cell division protein FtsJ n=1 Tax=Cohnella pontilimi TaxID=2564100 RepID=A0A4U0F9D0_9BACL|nr:cyclic-phosphate processing receiver domain-containing protein [Cohnella pontilimi]TJY41297.1 cell division protein FtsJ [Cohnella pontilimi]
MMNVFLDDTRPCPEGFRLVRTVDQCIKLLKHHKIDVLSLDHDMGYHQPTGYDLAKYMVSKRLFANEIIIHSANPIGSLKMYFLLDRHKPEHVSLSIRPRPFEISPDLRRSQGKFS